MSSDWIGIDSGTPDSLVFGAGAMYKEYGQSEEQLIGATRGGATFTVDREIREIEIDGTKGRTKNLERVISNTATLEVTYLELSKELLMDLLITGSAPGDGTHNKIRGDNSLTVSDYIDTLSLVTEVSGTSDPAIFTLENAMVDGGFDFETADEDEGQLSVTYRSTYYADKLDTPPYHVKFPESVS